MNKLQQAREDLKTQITVYETMKLMRGDIGLSELEQDTLKLLYRLLTILENTRHISIRKEDTHEDNY